MKILVFIALLSAPAFAQFAQDIPALPPAPPELDASGVTGLLADKLKEAKGAVLVTWAGKPGGAAYLPIWTWHTADGTPIVEFPTIGYRGVQGQKPNAFSSVTFNLPGLSAKVFGSTWMTQHVTKSAFPPIFFGPAAIVPFDLHEIQSMRWSDWTKYAAVTVSVRISGKPLAAK